MLVLAQSHIVFSFFFLLDKEEEGGLKKVVTSLTE